MRKTTAKKAAATMRPISEEPLIFGRIIAERECRVGRQKRLLQLGTPHRASWKTETDRAFGVDAVQALMLAFDLIKVLLETTSSRVSWAASERPGDVGI